LSPTVRAAYTAEAAANQGNGQNVGPGNGTAGQLPNGIPMQMPIGPAGVPLTAAPPADPHVRMTPTAAGALLNLGPNESAVDKAVDLARRLEACIADNQMLTARVKSLQATGEGREQALAEAMRDVESATNDVVRSRADLEALRKENAVLRDRLRQLEKEDLETLRIVISALERLLEPGPLKGVAP
jgi:septal ring factor EnvC (AmiA/AmiB activator)